MSDVFAEIAEALGTSPETARRTYAALDVRTEDAAARAIAAGLIFAFRWLWDFSPASARMIRAMARDGDIPPAARDCLCMVIDGTETPRRRKR